VSQEPKPGPLDQFMEWLAGLMDGLGLNGSRLRWKWMRRRQALAEAGVQREVNLRTAKGRHKMCPACRALVPKSASKCPECGESMAGVSVPGPSRLLANLFPGVTAVTSLLMLVNGLWFLLMLMAQMKAGGGGGMFSGIDGPVLYRFGIGASDLTFGAGEWWRLVTPIFVHAGLIHIFFNMYMLMILGPMVEQVFGPERYWLIYLIAGIGGNVLSQGIRSVWTLGASGAIFGLVGALLLHGLVHRSALGEVMKRLLFRLLIYSAVMYILGLPIDHLAHAGGFIGGAICGWLIPGGVLRNRRVAGLWQLAALAGVVLVLYSFYQVAAHLPS
jgi:membrane associated rhomboid family serine protease